MNILIIHCGHNSNVAYYKNGIPIKVLNEERVVYQKNITGLPINSLRIIVNEITKKNEKIEKIIFSSKDFTAQHLSLSQENKENKLYLVENFFGNNRKIYEYLESNLNFFFIITKLKDLIRKKLFSPLVKKKNYIYLKNNFNISEQDIIYYDHHLSHCLSPLAFYDIDQEEKSLAISQDGEGDFHSGKTYLIQNGNINNLDATNYFFSLGLMYSSVTKFLGFKVNEHEYKIMGLAAYGKMNERVKQILTFFRQNIFIDKNGKIKSKFITYLLDHKLRSKFSNLRFNELSFAIQSFLEEITLDYIKFYLEKTKPKNLLLSGGVFMNVKLNQKIMKTFGKECKIFIQPSSGDESLFLGAAYKFSLENKIKLQPMKHTFFGRDISTVIDDNIKNFEFKDKFEIKKIENIEEEIVEKLINNEIVAFANGKSEWGARSLCNRALLCNPSNFDNYNKLNYLIKQRDFWMPFAPVIMEEHAEKYIEKWNYYNNQVSESAKHMTLAFDVSQKAKEDIICAIHNYDYTCRPQIINKIENPKIYKVLKKFYEKTNLPVLLNTSLNVHGKPTNDTLDQIIDTSLNSNLEHIFIENYYLKKK